MNSSVDFFFNKPGTWQSAFQKLRRIILDTGLEEELKWGVPCYTYRKNNVVLMHGFKEYCALLFHKGALLNDEEQVLIQQTENVQAARQIRFTSDRQVEELEPVIKAYVFEAIEVEKAGLQVAYKKTSGYTMVDEFKKILDELPDVKKAFYSLTPGRQRGYLLHFSQAKMAKTRQSRIAKCIPEILEGKGLNDR